MACFTIRFKVILYFLNKNLIVQFIIGLSNEKIEKSNGFPSLSFVKTFLSNSLKNKLLSKPNYKNFVLLT